MILRENHIMSSTTNNNIKNENQVYKLCGQTTIRNQKTRMCKNISNCAFGERCHYAHKLDDLKIADCAFGKDCIFVVGDSDVYVNKKNVKLCYFRHPEEDDNHYNIRIGNTLTYTPPVKAVPKSPPRLGLENKESPIHPIRLSFDENEPTEWVTVGSKKKEVRITVSKSEVLNVVKEMVDKGVRRVCLTITY
jgi:hypothetical protein